MNNVAVFVGPGDFFVAQFNLLQMIVLLFGRVLDVVHHRVHLHHLHIFQFGIEVPGLLPGSVDFVSPEPGRLQGLSGGDRLVQIRAGRADFPGKQGRCMDTPPGQLTSLLSVGMYRLCSCATTSILPSRSFTSTEL